MKRHHDCRFSSLKLQITRKIAYRSQAKRAEEEECPFCRRVLGKPRRAFVKHVGQHMEEIALMALPRETGESPEEGSLDQDHKSNELSDIKEEAFIFPGPFSREVLLKHVHDWERQKRISLHCSRCGDCYIEKDGFKVCINGSIVEIHRSSKLTL